MADVDRLAEIDVMRTLTDSLAAAEAERDEWKAKAERLRESASQAADNAEAAWKDRDEWRALAGELAEELRRYAGPDDFPSQTTVDLLARYDERTK